MSVQRKDTHTDRVLNFHSNHARSAKTAVVRALMGRVRTHFAPTDEEGKEEEEKHVKEILRLNDYPDKFVRNVCRALENNDSKEGVLEQQGDVRWVSVP